MSFEDRLRRDLHSVPVPALRVPDRLADRALATARRQARVRAGAVAGLATLAVAAAVPSLLGVLPYGGTGPETVPSPTSGTEACAAGAPLPSRPPAQAWEYFDPLKYEIDASGVAGYQLTSYYTSTYFQTLELRNQARDRLVTVTLYAVNGVPHQSTSEGLAHPLEPQTGEPADPVRGEPAYWLPETTDAGMPRGQGLAWQWVPGAWVLVTVADTSNDAIGETPSQSTVDVATFRSLAAEIAPQLEFGRGIPVTSPFSMTIPDCTRVAGAGVSIEAGPNGTPITRFGLTFETQDAAAVTNPLLVPNDTGTRIGVHASWASAQVDGPLPTFDVDGHPAALGACDLDECAPDTAYGGIIYEVDGFTLDLLGNAGLKVSVLDLYEAIRFHPGATDDPATWGDPIAP